MRITVVTITYNAEACLKRTLDSVLSQTYPDVEHVIVDGCSKDKTLQIAKDYEQKNTIAAPKDGLWHKIVIQSEPDKGLYDAMNKGLQMANGDYIVFMNAGDTFAKPTTLATIAKAITDSPKAVGIAYGETLWTDDEGMIIGKRNHAAPKTLSWRSFRRGMLVCHQSFYAKTSIARSIPYDLNYRFSADIDWCIRVMKEAQEQGMSLVNVNEVVTHYQRDGQTTKNHRQSLKERFDIMCKHYGVFVTVAMHIWFVIRQLIGEIK